MKKVLFVAVGFFSIVGILAITIAVRNQTSTKTVASSCTTPPKMVLSSADVYSAMTIFHLKLINNCAEAVQFLVNVSQYPDSPEKYDGWSWKVKNGEWNTPLTTEKITGTSDITLTIQKPKDESGEPIDLQEGIYRFFKVETALAQKTSSSDSLDLTYKVN